MFKISENNTRNIEDGVGNHVAAFGNYIDAQRAVRALNEYETAVAAAQILDAKAARLQKDLDASIQERSVLATGLWRAFMWFGAHDGNTVDGICRSEWMAARQALKDANVVGL